MSKPEDGDNASSWGSALYFNVDPTTLLALHSEVNILMIKKHVFGFGTNVFDVTLSPNFRIGNLTIIPELRLDSGQMKYSKIMMAMAPNQLLQEFLLQHIIFKKHVHQFNNQ